MGKAHESKVAEPMHNSPRNRGIVVGANAELRTALAWNAIEFRARGNLVVPVRCSNAAQFYVSPKIGGVVRL